MTYPNRRRKGGRPRKVAQAVPGDEPDTFEADDSPDETVERLARESDENDDLPDVDGWQGMDWDT